MSVPQGEGQESLAGLAREIADDAVRLAKAEIDLAKAQAIASLKKVAVAAGMFAGAGLFALLMLIFALASIPSALAGRLFSGWVWWLLMALIFLLLGGFAALLGIRRLRRGLAGGKEMVGTVKEDVAWLKRLPKRNASES